MNNKKLLYTGLLSPLVFWITLFICGEMTQNYSHITNMVSELGAIGTETQYLFTTGLVMSSILSLAFVLGLYRSVKNIGLNSIPVLLILSFSFSIFGAAIFPLPLSLHGILGSPSMFLPLSPLLAAMLWNSKTIHNIRWVSAVILLFMILGFLVFAPNILDQFFGLKQRIFHISWTIWFIYLSISFLKKSPSK